MSINKYLFGNDTINSQPLRKFTIQQQKIYLKIPKWKIWQYTNRKSDNKPYFFVNLKNKPMLTIQKYEVDNTSIEKFSRLMPKFF